MYMVSFMLPCICWPEAFMLMCVDRNMVMTDSSGSTISRDRPVSYTHLDVYKRQLPG